MVAHRATKWKYLVAHKNIWLPEIFCGSQENGRRFERDCWDFEKGLKRCF
jgi:hypothetical protein